VRVSVRSAGSLRVRVRGRAARGWVLAARPVTDPR
jgi:hypothetical protein